MPTAIIPPITAAVVEAKPSSRRKPRVDAGAIDVAVAIAQSFCSSPLSVNVSMEQEMRYVSWKNAGAQ